MAGTTSSIISNLLSSLKRLSQVMPIFTSLTASFSSSSSSIVRDEVMVVDVNSIQESLMEDLSRLSRMLQRIQALLDDAEEREVHDKQTQLWLSELRKVAYDAEDILDQYDYQIIKTQVEGMIAAVEKPSPKGKQVDDDDKDFYGYQDWTHPKVSLKLEELMSADWDSDDNSRDKVLKRGILALEVLHEMRDNSSDEGLNEAIRALLALHT